MNQACQIRNLPQILNPRAPATTARMVPTLPGDATSSHAAIDVRLEIAVDDARQIAIRDHLARIRHDLVSVNLRRHRVVIERRGQAACLKVGERWWFEFNRPSRLGKLIFQIGRLVDESDWGLHCIGTVL